MARVDIDIKSRCQVMFMDLGDGYIPSYGYFIVLDSKIPLWSAVPNFDWENTDIWLEEGESWQDITGEIVKEPAYLICKDALGDMFIYGGWETVEDALAWLKNPEPLY